MFATLPLQTLRPFRIHGRRRATKTYAVSLCRFSGCDEDAASQSPGVPLCALHQTMFVWDVPLQGD
jgi:hypothetical protein